jgi:hypothetical protein
LKKTLGLEGGLRQAEDVVDALKNRRQARWQITAG